MGHVGEFEGRSLEELAGLVAGAEPRALMARGEVLLGLAEALNETGAVIAGRIDRMAWEGQAADTFREWGRLFRRESQVLDEFVRHVGEAILQAGQALSEAQSSMPAAAAGPVVDSSRGSATGSGFVGADFLDEVAAARAEENRQEAIRVMERLSSHYRVAAQRMANAEEPMFRAPPGREASATGRGPVTHDDSSSDTSSDVPPEFRQPEPASGQPQESGASRGMAASDVRVPVDEGRVGTSVGSVGQGVYSPASPVGGGPAVPGAGAGGQGGAGHASPGALPVAQAPAAPNPKGAFPGPPATGRYRGGALQPGGPAGAARPPVGPADQPGARSPLVGRPSPGGGEGGAGRPANRPGESQASPVGRRTGSGSSGGQGKTGGQGARSAHPGSKGGVVEGIPRPAEAPQVVRGFPKGVVIGPEAPAGTHRNGPDRRTQQRIGPVVNPSPPGQARNSTQRKSGKRAAPISGGRKVQDDHTARALPKDSSNVAGAPGPDQRTSP
ncbi:hypothetical protein GCM10009716_17080 [Streptomyces sodiiphilus]|uniref:Translation initiation factor IF-2 n=1 Tax=Streptomyces sodiiphilus TaxID=226217 RepID=A0ABN2P118_9ACTN